MTFSNNSVHNRALTSVNLLKNKIGIEQAQAFASILKLHPTLKSICGNKGDEIELDMRGKMSGAGDAIMLAAEIDDNGALSFAIAFDDDDVNDAVPEQCITKQSGNDPIKIGDKVTITWATHYEGENHPAVITAVNAPTKNNGALSSMNLLGNQIPVEQAHELVKIMQAKEKLTTLCGFSRREATLDVSNKGLGPGDAVLIANDIRDMKGLTRLDISKNNLFHADGTPAGKALGDMLAVNSSLQELDVSGNAQYNSSEGGAGFAQELAVGIRDNGARALTKLTFGDKQVFTMTAEMTEANFSGKLKTYEAQIVAAFLPKCT
jgi:hypothetical protein